MMNTRIFLKVVSLALIAIATAECTQKIAVFFDMNGVLLLVDKKAILKGLGTRNLIRYAIHDRLMPWQISKRLKGRYLSFLDTIKPSEFSTSFAPCDDEGNPLPQIWYDWFIGADSLVIRDTIIGHIEKSSDWFTCRAERDLMYNLTMIIFTPELFAQTQVVNQKMIPFLKRCKAVGCDLYILSNWGNFDSFRIIKDRFPELFSYFEPGHILLSGDLKAAKPFKDVYSVFNAVNADLVWFVDDQAVNLIIPKSMGVRTIHYQAKKFLGGLLTQLPDINRLLITHNA